MKRWICLFTVLASLTGCARAAARAPAGEKVERPLNIVSATFVPFDFARRITGGKAEITMLLPPGADSHSYEPTARDILKIRGCDVFIYGGGKSDAWVDGILASMDTDRMLIITMIDCAGSAGHNHDEHVWTSPRNAKLIAQKIADAVCGANADNAEFYRRNTAAFLEELDSLDAAFRAVVDNAGRKTVVFGDRFPFRHLADEYGLEFFAAFPGCAHETEPSAKTVAFLINKVREEQIPVVFYAEPANTKLAETISEGTDAKVLLLHACHTISQDDFESGVTYIELMTRNAEALKEALW
jgi:zinc transport system substrate-binding protein